jgi:hypothetical protein
MPNEYLDDLYPQTVAQKIATGKPARALDLPDDVVAFYIRILNRLAAENKQLRDQIKNHQTSSS